MIVRNFNLLDIKRYEAETGNNILSYFTELRVSQVLDLISLGNGNCGIEEASKLLDKYLMTGKSYVDIVLEIKEALLGVGADSEDEAVETIDISKYESLTDLYITFSMQLLSVGLSYQEFWSMSTKEMYKVFNSIVIKMQNETNRELNNYHTLAAMMGAAVWGKLQKEPPKVSMVNNKDDEVEDMDVEDAILVARLKSLAGKFSKED